MRSVILFLVLLALAALAALLWWRFKGSGQPAAPAAALATRNHHSLRTFHYEPAAAAQAAIAAVPPEAGAALARLLPAEDLAGMEPGQSAEAESATTLVDSRHADGEHPDQVPPAAEAPRPASIRHAAGALGSLLDAQEDAAAPVKPASAPATETDEEPAEALFHNPLTAPAPTANDQANRAAAIALRQQRRARMSADAAAQRAALSDLFPGAGNAIPTTKPS
ncbi:hypothetical protein [Hymenobacter canadensis]|uniref:Uncharacterized protein n=1 Tax=Hymenobacter canadensis TaxID=2999067 RepID=A0ABY7LZY2_9BACT|nr:hypothetical protein [Hymenobacter canadensis]WBA44295.1 hypothetical protein O3303_21710 [Hymenobacter canadensis]